jgi:glycosyltransferase involved in cell wall biosynthesis
MNPKVSVAIITYNHERFLGQALESILAQQFQGEFEIVVGEDCSTDNTRQVLLDYAARYPDIIRPLIRERNIGRGGRNLEATIRECRAPFIATLEGDDYWLTRDKLQKQVDFLEQHPDFSACHSNMLAVDAAGQITSMRLQPEPDRDYDLQDVLNVKYGSTVAVRSLMFRREAFPGFPPWVAKQKMADKALTIILAQHGKIRRFGEAMAAHRFHEGGLWTTLSFARQKRYQIRHWKAVWRWIDPAARGPVDRQLLKNRGLLGFGLLTRGQWRRGWRILGGTWRRYGRSYWRDWLAIAWEQFRADSKRTAMAVLKSFRGKASR